MIPWTQQRDGNSTPMTSDMTFFPFKPPDDAREDVDAGDRGRHRAGTPGALLHRTSNLLLQHLHTQWHYFRRPRGPEVSPARGEKEPTRHIHTRHGPGALLSKHHNQQTIYILMYINKETLAYGRKASAPWDSPTNPWWSSPIHALPLHTHIVSHGGIGAKVGGSGVSTSAHS